MTDYVCLYDDEFINDIILRKEGADIIHKAVPDDFRG